MPDEIELTRLNADIPKELHHSFKMACISREETMTDVLEKFVRQYVKLTKERGTNK